MLTRFSHVYHLEICFRCVTSSQQWLRTSRGQWSWRSWGRETSLRLSSRWVVSRNVVHTILKHILTILVFEKSTAAVFRISPILSTSYVRTVLLPARVISRMWTSCVTCIRWIIRNEILNFFTILLALWQAIIHNISGNSSNAVITRWCLNSEWSTRAFVKKPSCAGQRLVASGKHLGPCERPCK